MLRGDKREKDEILEMVLFLKELKDAAEDKDVSTIEAVKLALDFKKAGRLIRNLDANRKYNAKYPLFIYNYIVHKVYPRIKASDVDDYIEQAFYLFTCIKNVVTKNE